MYWERIKVKGKGKIKKASVNTGWNKKVEFLGTTGQSMGKVTIGGNDSPIALIQEQDHGYLVSSRFIEGQGGCVTRAYNVRELSMNGKVNSNQEYELTRGSYTTSPGKTIVDFVFNSVDRNLPAFAFSEADTQTGHEGHFVECYQPITVIDLQSRASKELTTMGARLGIVNDNGSNFLSIVLPASVVPDLIKASKSKLLEQVFDNNDLELVRNENEELELCHRPGCWGTHSCISPSGFEFVQPFRYPKYRISMDIHGNIYKAERVF